MTEKEQQKEEKKKSQPVKIQLNSEEGVLAFIEGNPDLQLEIKNKVACNIAKGHERIDKSVIENSVPRLTNMVIDQVRSQFFTQVRDGWHTRTVLNKDMEEAVEKYCRFHITATIEREVSKMADELNDIVKSRIDGVAARIERKVMDEIFENSVQAEVNRRFAIIEEKFRKGEL